MTEESGRLHLCYRLRIRAGNEPVEKARWWYWRDPWPGGDFKSPGEAMSEFRRVFSKPDEWIVEVYSIGAVLVREPST